MRQVLSYVVSVFLIYALSLGGSGLLGGCNKRERQAVVSKWTCPMHPEVVSAQEGLCPKCNMKLVQAKDEPKHNTNAEPQLAKPAE